MKNVNKISIIGGPGTGKSTLADNLGRELNIPIYHLDTIDHLENWKKRDKKERDKMILDITKKDKWVIDGTYKDTLEERLNNSDLIIFLDYSTVSKLKGIFFRFFKYRGKERPEIPGCMEKMDWKFISFTINWNRKKRKLIKNILNKNKYNNLIILKNRNKENKWFYNEFNKKIQKSYN